MTKEREVSWKAALNISDASCNLSSGKLICMHHFNPSDIINGTGKTPTRLRNGAIPMLPDVSEKLPVAASTGTSLGGSCKSCSTLNTKYIHLKDESFKMKVEFENRIQKLEHSLADSKAKSKNHIHNLNVLRKQVKFLRRSKSILISRLKELKKKYILDACATDFIEVYSISVSCNLSQFSY